MTPDPPEVCAERRRTLEHELAEHAANRRRPRKPTPAQYLNALARQHTATKPGRQTYGPIPSENPSTDEKDRSMPCHENGPSQ